MGYGIGTSNFHPQLGVERYSAGKKSRATEVVMGTMDKKWVVVDEGPYKMKDHGP